MRLRVERWARTPRSPVRLGLPCTLPLQSVWRTQPLRTHLHEAAAVARVHTCTLPPPSLRYTPRACAAQRWSSRRPRHTAASICTPLATRTASHWPPLSPSTRSTHSRAQTFHTCCGAPRSQACLRGQASGPRRQTQLMQGSAAKEGGHEVTWFRLFPPGGGMLVTEVTDVCLVANRSAGPQAQREAAQMHRRAP